MSTLVSDCPRCGANKITFDLKQEKVSGDINYGWQRNAEVFCVCRNCSKSTIFYVSQENSDRAYGAVFLSEQLHKYPNSINAFARVEHYISLKDHNQRDTPEFLPKNIESIFNEGCTCLTVKCFNAAGTMFRLCVDLATLPLLPNEEVEGLNSKTKRDLGLRISWLFANGKLPDGLKELSTCIREDGNDGAHRGSLTEEDVEDLYDFTFGILERLFTEPNKIKIAEERRAKRRSNK